MLRDVPQDDNPALDNVDVMTEASGATNFTRYTVGASSARSGHTMNSRQSRRSSRKSSRKSARGRRGTVEEEIHLLESFIRLTARIRQTASDLGHITGELCSLSDALHASGASLSTDMAAVRSKAQSFKDLAWSGGVSNETENMPDIMFPDMPNLD